MTKQETIAHAVRGSNGERHVCLGFVEAINKARYLAEQSPSVQYSVVELIERPADEPTCWQPIATAPETGYILGAWKDGKWHVREMFREHDEWVDTMSDRILSPTHWAPTPSENRT